MVLVAIAGGSSPTLGHSIVTAIREAGSHIPVILSRSKPGSDPGVTTKYGAEIRYVDYGSVSSLTHALQGVHTVLTVISSVDPGEMTTAHSNLLAAAQQAGCRRFAPSAWDTGPLSRQVVDLLRLKQHHWAMCEASGLECATFTPGWFMNYLGQGCPAEKREEACAGLDDPFLLDYVDVAKGRVVVPLTREGRPGRVTLTEMGDIGRFVAAALDLEEGRWEANMGMVGSTVDLEEVVRVAERVTGTKFEATKVTEQELKLQEDGLDQVLANGFSVEALLKKMVVQLWRCACQDQTGNQIIDPVLNRLCPHVKPVGFEEYLERFWHV